MSWNKTLKNKSVTPALREGSGKKLRTGFSTGACASAASKAAMLGFLRGEFPRTVEITLPRGDRPEFTIERAGFLRSRPNVLGLDLHRGCYAVVRKDAGDDPDVTHRALILVALEPQENEQEDGHTREEPTVNPLPLPPELLFRAGRGVGVVTLAGLPLAVGEPAINPAPRRMILANLQEAIDEHRHERAATPHPAGMNIHKFRVTISVANGVRLAEQTWNARLGIVGGLSILGTTGIVVPYSCSAWIHAIQRGVDVARANGVSDLAAATGRTSEQSVMRLLGLPQTAIIDMGDFAGGMLKYMRKQPAGIGCLTIAGGFGKMVKLAQGNSDLHSGRSSVDFAKLASLAKACGCGVELCEAINGSASAAGVLALLADSGANSRVYSTGSMDRASSSRDTFLQSLAIAAREEALRLLQPSRFSIGIVIVDRAGELLVHLPAR